MNPFCELLPDPDFSSPELEIIRRTVYVPLKPDLVNNPVVSFNREKSCREVLPMTQDNSDQSPELSNDFCKKVLPTLQNDLNKVSHDYFEEVLPTSKDDDDA